jgi:hypothetical protein
MLKLVLAVEFETTCSIDWMCATGSPPLTMRSCSWI